MRIPRSRKIRYYAAILSLIFIVGGAFLLLYTNLSVKTLEQSLNGDQLLRKNIKLFNKLSAMSRGMRDLNIGIAIISGTGILFAFLLFITSFRSRISKYLRIVDRLDLSNPGPLNLANLNFPEEDEFGNLGSRLNKLVSRMEQFDRLKGDRIRSWKTIIKELDQYSGEAAAVITSGYAFAFTSRKFNEMFDHTETKELCKINAVFQDETLPELTTQLIEKQSAAVDKEVILSTDSHHCKCRIIGIPILDSNYNVSEIFFVFKEIKISKKK